MRNYLIYLMYSKPWLRVYRSMFYLFKTGGWLDSPLLIFTHPRTAIRMYFRWVRFDFRLSMPRFLICSRHGKYIVTRITTLKGLIAEVLSKGKVISFCSGYTNLLVDRYDRLYRRDI